MLHTPKTGLLTIVVTCLSLITHAQQPGDTLKKQSAYYDALVLYYASRGINAYPLSKDPSSVQAMDSRSAGQTTSANTIGELVPDDTRPDSKIVGGSANPMPGTAAPTDKETTGTPPDATGATKAPEDGSAVYYIIYESSTGKVLKDNVANDELESALEEHRFGDSASRNALIMAVLSRDVESDIVLSPDSVLKLYADNPYYLEAKLRETLASGPGESFNGEKSMLGESSALSGLKGGGSGSMTDLIVNGVTDYLVDQVNAEFDEAFLSRLRRVLGRNKALAILFPETLASLRRIEISQYTQALSTIRSAYQTDIRNLLGHVSGLADIPKISDTLKHNQWLALVFAGCDVVSMLRSGAEPAEVLARLGSASYVHNFRDSSDYAAVLATASLLSNSLRDVHVGKVASDKDSWLLPGRIRMLMNNPGLLRLYLCLLVQQAKTQKISFSGAGGDRVHFSDLLSFKSDTDVDHSGAYLVYNFLHTEQQMEDAVTQYRNARKAAGGKDEDVSIAVTAAFYTGMANLFVSLAEDALDMAPSDRVAGPRKVVDKIRRTYLPVLNQMNAVVGALDAKDYNLVVYHLDSVLLNVLDKPACDTFIRYGTFIASVAMAKTSDDVKAAIKAIALPTGSSRIKKEHGFSWGLNAYAGVYHANNTDADRYGLPKTEWGITAPIGFAFSWGLRRRHGSIGALSLYGGLVDVGAIFAYKLDRDSTFVSGIQLGQLLSPSLGLYYGLPVFCDGFNIPLSIGATYQWGPRLKKVSEKGNSVLPAMTSRFNVSLVFDLPILNFHVSRK